MQERGQQSYALSVRISTPQAGDTVGRSFPASGTYQSSFGTPYITCTIEGKTFVAVPEQNNRWSCTSITAPNPAPAPAGTDLVAHIYASQGAAEADHDTHNIFVT
jgi:hypothetical protein